MRGMAICCMGTVTLMPVHLSASLKRLYLMLSVAGPRDLLAILSCQAHPDHAGASPAMPGAGHLRYPVLAVVSRVVAQHLRYLPLAVFFQVLVGFP